jgi:prepilin-type N-terminal cleavage/methylation domain-containing protein
MKYSKKHIYAFTLIELLVSMTIFSIIMVSVIAIFLFSSQMSTRVELNRTMQENIKNSFEDIAEAVRKDNIIGVRNFGALDCNPFQGAWKKIQTWSIICIGSSQYTLWYFDGSEFRPVDDISAYCWDIQNTCYIIKKQLGTYYPLTNSFMSFEGLEFILSNESLPKLTLKIQARPAISKWLSVEMLQQSRFHLQTTFSERLIETK